MEKIKQASENKADKVKAFAVHILEECERKGFTVNDVAILISRLDRMYKRDREKSIHDTLFSHQDI